MSESPRLSPEQVEAIAEIVGLRLPPERLATLTANLSQFLADFAHVQAIAAGDAEPPVLTFDAEGREGDR